MLSKYDLPSRPATTVDRKHCSIGGFSTAEPAWARKRHETSFRYRAKERLIVRWMFRRGTGFPTVTIR